MKTQTRYEWELTILVIDDSFEHGKLDTWITQRRHHKYNRLVRIDSNNHRDRDVPATFSLLALTWTEAFSMRWRTAWLSTGGQ
jgi:hypothetical protein